MRRHSAWDVSCFNLKQDPEEQALTALPLIPVINQRCSELPPSVPVSSLQSHGRSISVIDSTSVEHDVSKLDKHRPTSPFRRLDRVSPCPTEYQDSRASSLSTSLHMAKQDTHSATMQTEGYSHNAPQYLHPSRQISDSSHTSRSKHSNSSGGSRTSSRSSLDESIEFTEVVTTHSASTSPFEHNTTTSPLLGRTASRGFSHKDELTTTSRTASQLSIHPDLDIAPSKRGARLGRQMFDSVDEKWNERIVIPFIPSDSPAITAPRRRGTKLRRLDREGSYARHIRQESYSDDLAPEVVESVLLCILRNVQSLSDLKSLIMVNKGFYYVFKSHEKVILERIVFSISPPLWELQQVLMAEQKHSAFKLKSLERHQATIEALQSFVLKDCQHFCRLSALQALMEQSTLRRMQLDNAMWRIATFCRLFGKSPRPNDLKIQMLWLNGGGRYRQKEKTSYFGVGNGPGLPVQELEDMSEMWSCLENLLGGFRDREDEARKAGVFEGCVIDDNNGMSEQFFLEAWIQELLQLGPKAILALSSCSFEQARMLGATRWKPPTNNFYRPAFLRVAVEEVYRERLITEARDKAVKFKEQVRQRGTHIKAASDSSDIVPRLGSIISELKRMSKLDQSDGSAISTPSEHSEYSRGLSIQSGTSQVSTSISTLSPTNATALSSLSAATNASMKMGSSLFPAQPQVPSKTRSHAKTPSPTSPEPENADPAVPDPVDQAMAYLVSELGFPEIKAKQALALCDNGSGIDVQKAVDLLTVGSIPTTATQTPPIFELPAAPVPPPATSSTKVSRRSSTSTRVSMPRRYIVTKNPSRQLGSTSRSPSALETIADIVDQSESPISPLIDSATARSLTEAVCLPIFPRSETSVPNSSSLSSHSTTAATTTTTTNNDPTALRPRRSGSKFAFISRRTSQPKHDTSPPTSTSTLQSPTRPDLSLIDEEIHTLVNTPHLKFQPQFPARASPNFLYDTNRLYSHELAGSPSLSAPTDPFTRRECQDGTPRFHEADAHSDRIIGMVKLSALPTLPRNNIGCAL